MMKKLLFAFTVLGLALASAKTYRLTFYDPVVVGGAELTPGEYKMEIKNDKVVITDGKHSGEAPVKVEKAESNFTSTSVRYQNADRKFRVNEIRLGGTNLKLVLSN